jgi:hypothetical protein
LQDGAKRRPAVSLRGLVCLAQIEPRSKSGRQGKQKQDRADKAGGGVEAIVGPNGAGKGVDCGVVVTVRHVRKVAPSKDSTEAKEVQQIALALERVWRFSLQ